MQYVVEPGEFELQVGGASDKIALRKRIGVALDSEQKIILNKADGQTRNIKKEKITVTGYVRDVQSNPVENVIVESEGRTVRTDKNGYYSIETYSTSSLFISGEHVEAKTASINGERNINVVVIRK